MFSELLIVLLSVILYSVHCYYARKRKYKCLDHIPGPKPLPVLGNVLEFGKNPVDFLRSICRLLGTYGNTIRVYVGPMNVYLISADPDLVEFLLNSRKYIKKSRVYDFLQPWLANGLLTSTGSYWQKRRKAITPTFHFKILEEFVPVFNSNGDILVEKLSKETGKEVFNIYPHITSYTLDIICETAMGTKVNAQLSPNNEYCNAINTICKIFINRAFSAWDIFFRFTSDYTVLMNSLKIVHDFINSVIDKRRKELLENEDKQHKVDNEDIGTKKKVAFLDLLLKATIDEKPLSDDDIREEVNTFMFGGHDTTASAISFALYEIARNPRVQNKIIDELSQIFSDDINRQPTIQDLNNMKYLEIVIKESLRLYPSVPYFSRLLQEDATYKGTVLPKGLTIRLVTYYMHRRNDLFQDAEKFYPERFLENNDSRHPFAFVPFSAGPRNCIGQKFAMYEVKSTLSKILRNFKVSSAPPEYNVVLASEIILKSANGVNIRLDKRVL